jgi:ApaG protein
MITSKTTLGIEVSVYSRFEPGYSNPKENLFFFSYHIHIQNHSHQTMRLVSRYWDITDGNMTRRVVEGPGVVGRQPLLKQGEEFRYSSGCDFDTPIGIMKGHYVFVDEMTHQKFHIDIPAFSMIFPPVLN